MRPGPAKALKLENALLLQECFPYISRRLLSDDDPRVRRALRDVLYGGKQRLDVERWAFFTAV
jgi:aarF domain-containing kinase